MSRYVLLAAVAALCPCAFTAAQTPNAAKPQTPISTVVPASPLVGKPSENPRIDPQAIARLQAVDKTMFALKTYRAECRTTISFDPQPGEKPRPDVYRYAALTAAKPNLMRYDSWDVKSATDTPGKATPNFTFTNDGKKGWRQYGDTYQPNLYLEANAQSTLEEPWLGFYDGAVGPGGFTTYGQKKGWLREVRFDGKEIVNGVSCAKIFVYNSILNDGQTAKASTTWYVGPDNLVRRCVQWGSTLR